MKHKRLTAVALTVTVGAVGVATAIATPGTGILGAPILARGTLEADHSHDGHTHKRHEPVEITLQKPSDVAVQQVTLAPGGSTGWHSHPGPAVVIVKSGSLTLYDGDDRRCQGTTYSADPAGPAGKVFIDEGRGHVHKWPVTPSANALTSLPSKSRRPNGSTVARVDAFWREVDGV